MNEGVSLLRLAMASSVIIGLLALFALLLRFATTHNLLKWNKWQPRARRIETIDSISIDARRRMVLMRVDNAEYLIMLGANSESIIEKREAIKNIADERVGT